MKTVSDLIDEVAQLVNDAETGFENIRWTRPELLEYANDAALQIAALRPDLFATSEPVELKPGERQTLPDGVLFNRIDGTYAASGALTGRPYQADATAARIASTWFDSLACRDSCGAMAKPYSVQSWVYDPAEPSTFYVAPPVPASPPVTALVSVIRTPDTVDESDTLAVGARFHNAAVEWMLYRAFGKDEESATSLAHSDRHKQHFYEILSLVQRVDNRFYRQQSGQPAVQGGTGATVAKPG